MTPRNGIFFGLLRERIHNAEIHRLFHCRRDQLHLPLLRGDGMVHGMYDLTDQMVHDMYYLNYQIMHTLYYLNFQMVHDMYHLMPG